MEETTDEEVALADKLKTIYKDNIETDIKQSASILHQFGLIYRKKSPDKISLIRSAVFFNAVLSRQPSNKQFIDDKNELWFHVLKLANAQQPNQNLTNISLHVRVLVDFMRNDTKESLRQLDIIPLGLNKKKLNQLKTHKVAIVNKLQNNITASFIEIMDYISSKCCEIIGKAPCKFAVVGMGSLARKEVTPFSDFEHVIVLEEGIQHKSIYQESLEYFRWFSVVFQLIIVDLKETIIPSIAVPVLNNSNEPEGDWFYDSHTTRGISFDGLMVHACKFPLGRTQCTDSKKWRIELIKPVSEMLQYLKSEVDLKNGYHLGDILTKTCFVSGCKLVYDSFEDGRKRVLQKNYETNMKGDFKQLLEDLASYSAVSFINSMGLEEHCNIKRVIYRTTTLFVSALARYHSINQNSCFEIIYVLNKKRLIHNEMAEALSFAVAVACETRLKCYIAKQSQSDRVGGRGFHMHENKIIKEIVSMIGEQSLGDYFNVCQSFQSWITKILFSKLQPFSAHMFRLCDLEEKFELLFTLDLRNYILTEWEKLNQEKSTTASYTLQYFVAYAHIKNGDYKSALYFLNAIEKYNLSFAFQVQVMRRKAFCLCEDQQHADGIVYIDQCFEKHNLRQNLFGLFDHELAYLIAVKADCKRHLQLFNNAIDCYIKAIKHAQTSESLFKNYLIAKCYYFIGECQNKLSLSEDAVKSLDESLNLCQSLNIELSWECRCHRLLGKCHLELNQSQKALQHFNFEFDIRERYKDEINDSAEELKLSCLIEKANRISTN